MRLTDLVPASLSRTCVISVVGRKSASNSLFDEAIVTFEDDRGAYDQKDAEGFIKLNALRMRIAGKR